LKAFGGGVGKGTCWFTNGLRDKRFADGRKAARGFHRGRPSIYGGKLTHVDIDVGQFL
jgi:hypothetical protein